MWCNSFVDLCMLNHRTWSQSMMFLMCCWIWKANIFWEFCLPILLPCCVLSSDFGIKGMLASYKEFQRILSISILLNNLTKTGINSTLKFWWHLALKPSIVLIFFEYLLLIQWLLVNSHAHGREIRQWKITNFLQL